jgi:sugar lactone lactonase YvrE
MAISADGVYVIVSAHNRLFLFERATGKFVRQKMCDTLRRVSDYSLEYFETPGEIAVASDGWIYVALPVRKCVAVFTPDVTFQGTINMPRQRPIATCVNDDFLVVGCSRAHGEEARNSVFIYRRCDHKHVRSLGRTHDLRVRALCFLSDQRTFAILDASKEQVFMFSLGGVCLRVINIGGVTFIPNAIACSGFGELCVFMHDDVGYTSLHVFSEYGELLQTVEHSGFMPLCGAVHNGTLYVCGKGDGGDDAAAPLPWILCEYK